MAEIEAILVMDDKELEETDEYLFLAEVADEEELDRYTREPISSSVASSVYDAMNSNGSINYNNLLGVRNDARMSIYGSPCLSEVAKEIADNEVKSYFNNYKNYLARANT